MKPGVANLVSGTFDATVVGVASQSLPEEAAATDSSAVAVAAAIVATLAVGLVLWLGRAFLLPFAVAVLMTVSVSPMLVWLRERMRLPSWLAVTLVVALVGLAIAGAGSLTYAALSELLTAAPDVLEEARKAGNMLQSEIRDALGGRVARRFLGGSDVLGVAFGSGRLMSLLQTSIGSSLGFVSSLGLTLLFFVFLVTSRRALRRKLRGLLSHTDHDEAGAEGLLDEIAHRINEYLWLKAVISVVTGVVFGGVAWLAGLPFAVFWGILGFALNFVPSIGPIVASVPPVILCFIEFESRPWAIAVATAMVSVQVISGNIVEPKLMGQRLNLNIVTVLLCLFFWGLAWGPMGMLLAVPLTVAIHSVMAQNPRTRYLADLLAN